MTDPKDNRQYAELLAAAVKNLRRRAPADIAEKAGIEYESDTGFFSFVCLGQSVRLDIRSFMPEGAFDMWRHLTCLQYLACADGREPGDKWISLSGLPDGGLVRALSFERETERLIAEHLSRAPLGRLRDAAVKLGGVIRSGTGADITADIYFMPRYVMRLNFWAADEEFPASGRLLLNEGSSRTLGTEAAGTVGAIILDGLCALCGADTGAV